MEMAGKGFGTFMQSNAANEEFGVNVGGQIYTLSSAPNQAIRQAVAAKMAASYLQPYAGMNKSFLGKYLYPGMQMGMQGAVAGAAQAHAKLMKANRLDAAQAAFRGAPSPAAMMELDNTLRNDGYDNKTIRTYLISEMIKVKSDTQFETLMNTPYGPNGKPFQEQYPQEAAELRIKRQEFLQRGVQEREMARQTQDRIALEDAKQLVASDYAKDGELNARPERLTELAQQARAAGNITTAQYWEGQIANTAYMQRSADLKRQYEQQMMAGIVPSREEILQNPGLSMEHKQALLGTAQSNGGSEPNTDLAKGHKSIIQDSIRKRGKWTRDGSNDPGVAAMEMLAMQEYKRTYNNEIQSGKTPEQAANAALNDFKSQFSNEDSGLYALVKPGSDEAKKDPSRVGKYAGYDPNGVASTTVPAITQVNEKLKYADANTVLNTYPDLFHGEEKMLQDLSYSFNTTGKVGAIPPVYYELQQRYGGNVSIMDLVNKRLEANGLEPLPKELNQMMKPVEETFDDETYRYISYKPNTTRTDIGLIGMGQQAVYQAASPAQRLALDTIAKTESGSYGYDAVNQGGKKGGTQVKGYSGRYSQMPTRKYDLPLTQMTIGQIMEQQDPRYDTLPDDASFQAAGGLHAVGRYQIIGSTLKTHVERLGIPLDTVFSPEVQDYIALSILNSQGAGAWVGPSAADREIIQRGKTTGLPLPPWRQPANMRIGL